MSREPTLASMVAPAAPALWPLAGEGWWPMPLPHGTPNATWEVGACDQCRAVRLRLVACIPLAPGSPVWAEGAPHLVSGGPDGVGVEVTFDGGARSVSGTQVAGAGVVLWARQPAGLYAPALLLRIELPGESTAPVAEAWGLRGACRVLAAHGSRFLPVGLPGRFARVVGDNLAVVRFAACSGRLHDWHLQGLLEEPLASLAALGWAVEWLAARRRFNQAADAEATAAVMEAGRRAAIGSREVLGWLLDLTRPGATWAPFSL